MMTTSNETLMKKTKNKKSTKSKRLTKPIKKDWTATLDFQMTNLSTKEIRSSMKKYKTIYFNLVQKMIK